MLSGILVGLLFGFLLLRYLTSKRNKLPPGPRGLPFFGNAFQLDRNAPHETATGWSDKYGDVFKIKVCLSSMVPDFYSRITVITSVIIIIHCKSTNLMFKSRKNIAYLKEMIGIHFI